MGKKIMWFSRHLMSDIQKADLIRIYGDVEIVQINKTINSIKELGDISEYDIYAVVAPIGLQAEFLRASNGKPVIIAVSKRIIIKSEDGSEDKIQFAFDYWEQLDKIEVVKHRL